MTCNTTCRCFTCATRTNTWRFGGTSRRRLTVAFTRLSRARFTSYNGTSDGSRPFSSGRFCTSATRFCITGLQCRRYNAHSFLTTFLFSVHSLRTLSTRYTFKASRAKTAKTSNPSLFQKSDGLFGKRLGGCGVPLGGIRCSSGVVFFAFYSRRISRVPSGKSRTYETVRAGSGTAFSTSTSRTSNKKPGKNGDKKVTTKNSFGISRLRW